MESCEQSKIKKQRKRRLKGNVIHQFPEYHISFDVFCVVTNLDAVVKYFVYESGLCAQRKGREFDTNEQEMRAFLESN